MIDAWQILRAGGLPLVVDGALALDARPRATDLARATREAIAGGPTGREADALVAFVRAWHDHWTACFADTFGDDAGTILGWADARRADRGRFVKLRRLAIENLARVL